MIKTWVRDLRIGVLLGGTSAEREISLKTGRAICDSLCRQKLPFVAIDVKTNLIEQLRSKKISFAFIALHGPGGEDGTIQGLLEWLKIPYTGSGVLASAAAMDKSVAKRLFQSARLPTPRWMTVVGTDVSSVSLPCIVKPATQGSAIGINIVRQQSELKAALRKALALDTHAIVEELIEGPEVTVGVLGREALPVIEIVPDSSRPFYDFKAKYAPSGSRHLLPARLSTVIQKKCQRLAVKACALLDTRGAARVDLMIHPKKGPMLLEVNTIPGMTATSLLPEAALAAGYTFDQLVRKMMDMSLNS